MDYNDNSVVIYPVLWWAVMSDISFVGNKEMGYQRAMINVELHTTLYYRPTNK